MDPFGSFSESTMTALSPVKAHTTMRPDNGFIYIAGRGHSGSSILEIILGSHSNCTSLGEIASTIGMSDGYCRCGRRVGDCDYWKELSETYNALGGNWVSDMRLLRRQAHVRYLPKTVLAPNSATLRRLSRINSRLVESVSGCLVDSSKEVSRCLHLLCHRESTMVVHLVRSPVAVVSSELKRVAKGSGFRLLRRKFEGRQFKGVLAIISSLAWVYTNLMLELYRGVWRHRVVRVRYEDLKRHPEAVLTRTGRRAGLDLHAQIESIRKGKAFPLGHRVGGSGFAKRKSTVVFEPGDDRPDSRFRMYAPLVRFVAWPLMLRYGYHRRATG